MHRFFILLLLLPIVSLAGLKEEVESILAQRYGNANVQFQRFQLPRPLKRTIEAQSGQKFIKDFVLLWRIEAADEQRLAIVDAVRGKSAFITVMVIFDSLQTIERLDILNYTGDKGRGVLDENWLAQFVGKNADDDFSIGSGIDAVTGASYSAPAIARGARRWALLVRSLQDQGME